MAFQACSFPCTSSLHITHLAISLKAPFLVGNESPKQPSPAAIARSYPLISTPAAGRSPLLVDRHITLSLFKSAALTHEAEASHTYFTQETCALSPVGKAGCLLACSALLLSGANQVAPNPAERCLCVRRQPARIAGPLRGSNGVSPRHSASRVTRTGQPKTQQTHAQKIAQTSERGDSASGDRNPISGTATEI